MRNDLNTVTFTGNVGADPKLAKTNNETPVAEFSVASSRSYKQGDEWQRQTTWLDVKRFGKGAESLGEQLKKGDKVAVTGSLRQESWEDKETGKTRRRLFVVATAVQVLKGGAAGGNNGQPEADCEAEGEEE